MIPVVIVDTNQNTIQAKVNVFLFIHFILKLCPHTRASTGIRHLTYKYILICWRKWRTFIFNLYSALSGNSLHLHNANMLSITAACHWKFFLVLSGVNRILYSILTFMMPADRSSSALNLCLPSLKCIFHILLCSDWWPQNHGIMILIADYPLEYMKNALQRQNWEIQLTTKPLFPQ